MNTQSKTKSMLNTGNVNLRWAMMKLFLIIIIILIASTGIVYFYNARSEFGGTDKLILWKTLVGHYPHILLYPFIFCVPLALSLSSLIVFQYRKFSRTKILALSVIFIGSLCGAGVVTLADSSGDRMMLIEFAPSTTNTELYSHFKKVTDSDKIKEMSEEEIRDLAAKSKELFAYSSDGDKRPYAKTRILYLGTVFSVTFLVAILICLVLSSTLKRSKLQGREILAIIISIVSIACWLPFRAHFNTKTKAKLFPDSMLIDNISYDDVVLVVIIIVLLVPLLIKIGDQLGLLKDARAIIRKLYSFFISLSIGGFGLVIVNIFVNIFLLKGTESAWLIWLSALVIISLGTLAASLLDEDDDRISLEN